MRRLKTFGLFLLFAVISEGVTDVLGWGLIMKLHLFTFGRGWSPKMFIVGESLSLVAALIGAGVVALIQKRPIGDYGFRAAGAGRLVAAGSLWGLLLPTALVVSIAAFGGFTFGSVAMSGSTLAYYFFTWLVAFIGVGIAEEATFRGPALILLAESIGFWPAAVVLSTIFGAVHFYFKPGENIADALSVGLLGLFMCFTVKRTGSIWWAVGFHALFDYAALYLYGAPNSGNESQPIPTKLLTGGYHGAPWLTGGGLGIEASWLVFPLLAVTWIAFAVLYPARQTTSVAAPPAVAMT